MLLKLFLIALVLEACLAHKGAHKARKKYDIAGCKCRCKEIGNKNKDTSESSETSSKDPKVLEFDRPFADDNDLCLILEPIKGRVRLEFTDVRCKCNCKRRGKKSNSSSSSSSKTSSSSSSSSASGSGSLCEAPPTPDPLAPVLALNMDKIEDGIISGPANFEVKGDPTIIAGGAVGTAVEFDTLVETGCLFDSTPSSSSSTCPTDPNTCTSGFTVAAWVRDATPNDGFMFTFSVSNSVRFAMFGLTVSAGTNQYICPLTSVDLQDGQWHHLVFIHNTPDTTQPTVMVDNAITSCFPSTQSPDTYDDLRFKLGCEMAINATGPSGGFDGKMDEVRLFDRQLSAAEITELFNAGSPSPP